MKNSKKRLNEIEIMKNDDNSFIIKALENEYKNGH